MLMYFTTVLDPAIWRRAQGGMDNLIYIHKYDIASHSFWRNQIDGRS